MNRKKEQAELFCQLGQLLGPLLKMADNPASYDSDEQIRIHARFCAEVGGFINKAYGFSRGEPGHDYVMQGDECARQISIPKHRNPTNDMKGFRIIVQSAYEQAFGAIYSIPVPIDSAIHDALTPFSTYCLVKDLCSTAAQKIVWMDRYFDQTIFHRYFVDTPKQTLITLVTWPQNKCTSAKDKQRYADFIDVSKLFAQERGIQGYRLVVDDQFHDRWLQCDSKLFTLGGSIKDLGKDATFTISKLDSMPENQRHFDEAINRGTELFGAKQPVHL